MVVVGAQWGAEGKGRVTDLIAGAARATVRYQGGPNTGHTVVTDAGEFRLHLVPAGLLRGREAIIGNGCVLDPVALAHEVQSLEERGIDIGPLVISRDAHVILPHHRLYDRILDERRGADGVGTTRQGIGPAYADKALRLGVRVDDLLKPDLADRVEAAVAPKRELLGSTLDDEAYSIPTVVERYRRAGEQLARHVDDAGPRVRASLNQGLVVFEGAQGTFLDLDHGTYPWVTSSNPYAGGAASGSGAPPVAIAEVWGVMKPYVTRVGGGPFPTELHDRDGALLQERGREWGTTTGRRRRCGWLDLVALRQAVEINGIERLVVNKLDVLSGFENIRTAVAYRARTGQRLARFRYRRDEFAGLECEWEDLPGWDEDIGAARHVDDLPRAARSLITRITEATGVPVAAVGVGPHRDEIVWLEDPEALRARLAL